MMLLIGSYVKVVSARNPTVIGLEGLVVSQKSKELNYYIILETINGPKLIQKCTLLKNGLYINIENIPKKTIKNFNRCLLILK